MEIEEIAKRFDYHPPSSQGIADLHGTARARHKALALILDQMLPDCREKSLAFTAIEESMLWSNAAIARNQAEIESAWNAKGAESSIGV